MGCIVCTSASGNKGKQPRISCFVDKYFWPCGSWFRKTSLHTGRPDCFWRMRLALPVLRKKEALSDAASQGESFHCLSKRGIYVQDQAHPFKTGGKTRTSVSFSVSSPLPIRQQGRAIPICGETGRRGREVPVPRMVRQANHLIIRNQTHIFPYGTARACNRICGKKVR